MEQQFLAGVYKHFKGGTYQALGIAGSSSNGREDELEVVYICLYTSMGGPYMRTRLLKEWDEPVVNEAGKTVPRFEYVGIK